MASVTRPTLYVETSIVSYLTARRSRDIITAARQEITYKWWSRKRDKFTLYTSDIVVEEAAEGDLHAAQQRIATLDKIEKIEVDDEAQTFAERLLRSGPLPRKAAVDALHIAIASVHEMEYLLTWNCKHLANALMRNKIEEICRTSGYRAPVMCTPEELMEV